MSFYASPDTSNQIIAAAPAPAVVFRVLIYYYCRVRMFDVV